MSQLAQEYYNSLTLQAGPVAVERWEANIREVEEGRLDNCPAMDIYGTNLEKPTSPVCAPLDPSSSSLDRWMAFALTVEDKQ